MRFVFTCACGNALKVKAPSHQKAMERALDEGWRPLAPLCPICLEEDDEHPLMAKVAS
jgi:hypothetical protein